LVNVVLRLLESVSASLALKEKREVENLGLLGDVSRSKDTESAGSSSTVRIAEYSSSRAAARMYQFSDNVVSRLLDFRGSGGVVNIERSDWKDIFVIVGRRDEYTELELTIL